MKITADISEYWNPENKNKWPILKRAMCRTYEYSI